MSNAPAPQEDIEFFKSIAWCRALIENEEYIPLRTNSRIPQPDTEDSFFGATLNSPSTITHCLTLISKPRPLPAPTSTQSDPQDAGKSVIPAVPTITADSTTLTPISPPKPEVSKATPTPTTTPTTQDPQTITSSPIHHILLLTNLSTLLNGFPNIAHGGLLATLLDESMGILLTTNKNHLNSISDKNEPIDQVTAYLNVGYKGVVSTPGVVLIRAEVLRVVGGRKWFLRAGIWVVDGDGDGMGNLKEVVVGEGLFVAKRGVRL